MTEQGNTTQEQDTAAQLVHLRRYGLRIALLAIWALVSVYELAGHHTPMQRFCDLYGHCWATPAPVVQVERGDGR